MCVGGEYRQTLQGHAVFGISYRPYYWKVYDAKAAERFPEHASFRAAHREGSMNLTDIPLVICTES
jgi:hypothetical protein